MPRQTVPEGFATSDGRRMFSILFTLECPPPKSLQLVVLLDADGNASNRRARASETGKRIVDVFPGQLLQFQANTYTVSRVEAYRWTRDGVCGG